MRSQRGSGSVVTRGEAPGAHAYPAIRTVSDLLRSYEFRITVECATAAMAAERRDAADLADLARTLDRAESSIDRGVHHLLADLNFDFHRAVARATHNPFYLKTVEMIPNFIGAEQLDRNAFGDLDMARARAAHPRRARRRVRSHPPRASRSRRWHCMESHIALARDFVLERQELAAPDPIAAHAGASKPRRFMQEDSREHAQKRTEGAVGHGCRCRRGPVRRRRPHAPPTA